MADTEPIRLTTLTTKGGWAAKWSPGDLQEILKKVAPAVDPEVMLGFETSDDAAVYRINDDTAAILTLDFFTPVVDDPYEFGAIAAANALSDVFAMGAKPVCALNILAFPCHLGNDVVAEVMRGGSDKCAEAGAFVVGGHSVDDEEPKFGLSVFGLCHPDKIVRNAGIQAGDALYYTKKVGMGIMNSALRAGLIGDAEMREPVAHMMELNKYGAEAMLAEGVHVHAATDVTGFGLAGHLHEMLEPSGMAAVLHFDDIPLFDNVYQYSADYVRPGKVFGIINWARDFVAKGTLDAETYGTRMGVLCDPQTSGGMLVAIPKADGPAFETAFEALVGRKPACIGEAMEGPAGKIFMR